MTTDQITEVREQAYNLIDEAGYAVSDKTLAVTEDTLAMFCEQWEGGKEDSSISLPHRVWENVQKHGKGTQRGTLIVIDFGDVRVASFC